MQIDWPSTKKKTRDEDLINYDNPKKNAVTNYFQGKTWFFRAPILLFIIYISIRHITDPAYGGIVYTLNLFLHEGGHVVFIFFGQTLYVLGGTLMQLLMPILWIIHFWRKSSYIGMAVCIGWFGDNLFGVARYVGDARARVLPLLGGGKSGHDWHYLLSRWDILEYDTIIAAYIRDLAIISMIISIAFGIWLLWLMRKNWSPFWKKSETTPDAY